MERRKLIKLTTLSCSAFALPLGSIGVAWADQPSTPRPGGAREPSALGDTPYIKVTKSGSKIDPPVPTSMIPPGAWMCAMGKVHFAALEKGTGKCPLCGMKLTQKTAHPDGDGHHGHEH